MIGAGCEQIVMKEELKSEGREGIYTSEGEERGARAGGERERSYVQLKRRAAEEVTPQHQFAEASRAKSTFDESVGRYVDMLCLSGQLSEWMRSGTTAR